MLGLGSGHRVWLEDWTFPQHIGVKIHQSWVERGVGERTVFIWGPGGRGGKGNPGEEAEWSESPFQPALFALPGSCRSSTLRAFSPYGWLSPLPQESLSGLGSEAQTG